MGKKLMAALAIALLGSALLAACGGGSSSSSPSTESASTESASTEESEAPSGAISLIGGSKVELEGPLKIAFFINSANTAYGQAAVGSAEKYASEHGLDLTVFDGELETEVQINQLTNALTTGGYNAFLVQPNDSEAECTMVTETAPGKGILVSVSALPICGRQLKSGNELAAPGTLDYVGGESVFPGYAAYFKWIGENYKGKQKIAFVGGPAVVPATQAATAALKQELKENPEWELVTSAETDFSSAKGLAATQDILKAHPDVTAIISQYSEITVGIVKAVEGSGDSNVKVFDVGGEKQIVPDIESGVVTATAPYFPAGIMTTQLEALTEATEGKEVPPFEFGGEPNTFITKENVASFKPEY